MDKMKSLKFRVEQIFKGVIVKEFQLKHTNYQIEAVRLEECDSTQIILNDFITEVTDSRHIYMILSDKQTKGRGRGKNDWYSPTGNLYMSFSFITSKLDFVHLMPIIVSFAIHNVLHSATGSNDIKLKWINDIFMNEYKVGGILCESAYMDNQFYCSIGCGVNLVSSPEPNQSTMYETSNIMKQTGVSLESEDLSIKILQRFLDFYEEIVEKGSKRLRCLYEENLAWKGQRVILYDYEGVVLGKGILEGITDVGYIIIREDDKNTTSEFTYGTLRKLE